MFTFDRLAHIKRTTSPSLPLYNQPSASPPHPPPSPPPSPTHLLPTTDAAVIFLDGFTPLIMGMALKKQHDRLYLAHWTQRLYV